MPKKPALSDVDLRKIFDRVNGRFFGGNVYAGIGWRSINREHVGEYDYDERFILINKILQDARVPEWYIEVVVHHEMIHALLGPEHEGTDDDHKGLFECLERKHPLYEEAVSYEKNDLKTIYKDWPDDKEKPTRRRSSGNTRQH